VHNLPYNNKNVADHFVGQVSLLPCLFALPFHPPPRQPLHAKFTCSGGLINLYYGLDPFQPNL